MKMQFEELDDNTRGYMLSEFEAEIASPKPYISKALSSLGRNMFPKLMREAIETGDEDTLMMALASPTYWNEMEAYERGGVVRERRVNISQAAERLAVTEFNTWYVRGLTKRLMDEGVSHCQVYRAAEPRWQPATCADHEGQIYSVEEVYRGHRAAYWPTENASLVSIPFGPGCHHTIRRVDK